MGGGRTYRILYLYHDVQIFRVNEEDYIIREFFLSFPIVVLEKRKKKLIRENSLKCCQFSAVQSITNF